MTYAVTETETLVKYTTYHDIDACLTFCVTVEPIGTSIRLSAIKEEHLDILYTNFRVFYDTTTDIQVTLTWV